MNANRERLLAAIGTAASVLDRLRESLDEGVDLAVASRGSKQDRQSADAFIQRFQQSVEVMTRRLFGSVYRIAEADRPPPLLTLLAYLEEVGAISDENAWVECIEVRNALVHEYPGTPEARADAIERAQTMAPVILQDHAATIAFIDRLRLLEPRDDR